MGLTHHYETVVFYIYIRS